MRSRSQVTRNGVVIGEHDEQTLLALLNAGALRLSDSYWHRGMKAPAPLADLLYAASRRTWRARMQPWLAFAVPLALVSALWLRGASPMERAGEKPSLAVAEAESGSPETEIRRATPVIVGRLSFDSSPRAESEFPMANVELIAAHSRAAVLALDAQERPLAIGSGIVVGDGSQLVTSLRTVAGASIVEVHLANGMVLRPFQAVISAESGIVAFALPSPGVPVAWGTADLVPTDSVFVAGHQLGRGWQPEVAHVVESLAGEATPHFHLDNPLSTSANGAAILNSAGDLAGVVVDTSKSQVVHSSLVRTLLQSGIPGSLAALAALPRVVRPADLEVVEASVAEGSVVVTLHNRTEHPLRRALLHLACYQAPPEAAEVALLQERLRSAAVRASLVPDDAADLSLVARQTLREVTARLESALSRLNLALPEAQRRVQRHVLLAIECELSPGLPQAIAHEINAASNWGAVATVLDAGS